MKFFFRNTGCVVRFDTSKSFSSREDGDNVEGGQHKIARVTSELRLEVKSTVNSEKLMENNKLVNFTYFLVKTWNCSFHCSNHVLFLDFLKIFIILSFAE